METSQAEVIKKCRNDLQKERIIKSVLCGMAVGFAMIFTVAFITWIFEFKGLWLSVGLGFAAWIGAAFAFYFVVFKVTDITVMKRLDRAGLDERMITMYELQGDNSYIAQRQREDAQAAFAKAVKKSGGQLVKVKISAAIICIVSVVCGFALAMAVVTGLSDYNVIPTLGALCSGEGLDGYGGHGPGATTYTVTYKIGEEQDGSVKEGGMLNGSDTVVTDTVQLGATSSVTVRPSADKDGYMYYLEKWVDNDGNVYYTDSPVFVVNDIRKSMVFTAVFAAEPIDDERGYGYYYNPDDNSEPDENAPDDPDNRDPSDSPSDTPPPPPSNGPGGGGPTSNDNTIVDGETPYESSFDSDRAEAMDSLTNGSEGYPPELAETIEGYFGIL